MSCSSSPCSRGSVDSLTAFEQARLTFECKKLYADMIKPEDFIDQSIIDRWYGEAHGGFHKMYVVEIVNVLEAIS